MADTNWHFPIELVRILRSLESGYQGTVFAGRVGTVTPLPDALGGDQKQWPALQDTAAKSKDPFFELLRAKAHFLMLPETIVTTLKETSRVRFLEDSVGEERAGTTDCDEKTHTASIHIPAASQALARAASSLGRDNAQNLGIFKAIYHEMTHAWLCLHEFYSNDNELQKLYADGVAAYSRATLDTGRVLPAELAFTEAAAYYVGDKIARWCEALSKLDALSRNPPQDLAALDFELESIALGFGKFVPTYGQTLMGSIQSPDLSPALRDAIDKKVLDGLPLTKPFAETPLAGLRRALGSNRSGDGPIPIQYQKDVDKAIQNARNLKNNNEFVNKFVQIVNLYGGNANANTYGAIVDGITINDANTSQDPRIKNQVNADNVAYEKDPKFKLANGYSKPGDPARNIYIREERMVQGADAITDTIVHEATHLAGVGGLGELAIQEVEQASGFYKPE